MIYVQQNASICLEIINFFKHRVFFFFFFNQILNRKKSIFVRNKKRKSRTMMQLYCYANISRFEKHSKLKVKYRLCPENEKDMHESKHPR